MILRDLDGFLVTMVLEARIKQSSESTLIKRGITYTLDFFLDFFPFPFDFDAARSLLVSWESAAEDSLSTVDLDVCETTGETGPGDTEREYKDGFAVDTDEVDTDDCALSSDAVPIGSH